MRTAHTLLATAIALLLIVPVAAQEKQAKKKRSAVKIGPVAQAVLRLKKQHAAMETLDLTEEQKGKLKKLHEETGPKMKEAFGRLTDLLTEEQKTAAEEAVKKAKEAKKQDRQVLMAAEAAAKITDEQKKETDKIGQEMLKMQREMMKKIMGILTPEQKEKFKKAMRPKPKKKGGEDKKKAE